MSDRYTVLGSIAKGGMGIVYLGRMTGSAGFSRLVAIKRLHRELATERASVAMLVDEARMASRIRHANVIDTLDLVVSDGAFSLVLEYVEGESLSRLIARARDLGEKVPRPIALAIMYGVLRGLDAAHGARSEDGAPLGLVHRDMSPQNVLVGVDGVARVIDFGVAKAMGRLESTKPGEVRGKFAYMAPEQVLAKPVTRQADVYAAGVVLWELLANQRLFTGEDWRTLIDAVLKTTVPKPSELDADVPAELDDVVRKAMARSLGARYLTAREFLTDLEPFPRASDDEVGAWVRRLAAEELAARQRLVQDNAHGSDIQSVEDLMRDLARSGRADPTPAESALSMSGTKTLAPLTAAFAVPLEREPPPREVFSIRTEIATPAAPKRYGWALAAFALFVVVTVVGLRRTTTPTDEEPKPTTASTAAVPSAVTSLGSAEVPAIASTPPQAPTVIEDVPSSPPPAPVAPLRSAPAVKRTKPAPSVPAYDPGNFR